LEDEPTMLLCFAMGKVCEDLADYDKAYSHFARGNALARRLMPFDYERERRFIERLQKVFDADLLASTRPISGTGRTPIFVIGMPRSGTTLVEQIVSSHPLVHGAGELNCLMRIATQVARRGGGEVFPEGVARLSAADLADAASEYLRCSGHTEESEPFLTDKLPANFLLVGMIRLMFPNARVIHCQRDPIDTCMSCFKHYFPSGQRYSYDLVDLGRYYRLYQELMAHWHAVLPGFVYDIQYETLVADQERETRRLLEFCGLPWDEACLDFHRARRAVKTVSVAQVRRPVYQSSVQIWRRYEKHLRPLMDALGIGADGRQAGVDAG
jgi:hypothetical protein